MNRLRAHPTNNMSLKLEYHPGRFATSYGEAAFVLEFFSNGNCLDLH